MNTPASNSPSRERNALSTLALATCTLTLLCAGQARGEAPQSGGAQGPGSGVLTQGANATLEQCVTALTDGERSATFAGEMTTIAGAARMEMRIFIQERMPGEALFHNVNAPGLGVWRTSAPGVKAYKFLRQVTNLSAPASYRGAVRFRWLNAKGRPIRVTERSTPTCEQPAPPAGATTPSTGEGSTATTTGGSATTTAGDSASLTAG